MYTHNGRISARQMKLLLVLQMFNMSIIFLPRVVGNYAKNDGWLVPILSLVLTSIYILAITGLLNQFRGESFVDYSTKILPKPLAYLLILLFAIKLLIGAGFEVRLFSEMINHLLLPKTPLPVVMLVMLFTTYYVAKSGIEASGRTAEVLIYFVFVPLIIVFISTAAKTDYKQLTPLLQSESKDVLKATYYVSLSFMPIEFLLVTGGMLATPKKVRKVAFFAVGIITVVEVLAVMLTYTGIGVLESTRQIFPILTLIESVKRPGSFIENQEILVMAWWILSIYMYVSGALYVVSILLSDVLAFERKNTTVLPLIPIIFFIGIIPGGVNEAYEMYGFFHSRFGLIFLLIVPIILMIIARIRKVGERYE